MGIIYRDIGVCILMTGRDTDVASRGTVMMVILSVVTLQGVLTEVCKVFNMEM